MISAASVKARLKNIAVQENKPLQEKLINYGLERTICRIAKSRFSDRFTLKGGIFMYALFDGDYSRATIDIDLLAQRIPNDIDTIRSTFEEIFNIELDDAIVFDLESLEIGYITEFREYHGVNVSIIGYLDRTKVPVSIDIGFGDTVYPNRTRIKFPSLLNMEESEIYAYSIYSAIAEKFETFVSRGLMNSRYKDYYDIYEYARTYNLEGSILKEAIKETFRNRGTSFSDIVAFNADYISDDVNQRRWYAFVKKKKATATLTFEEVMYVVIGVLAPVTEAILENREFSFNWNCTDLTWNNLPIRNR